MFENTWVEMKLFVKDRKGFDEIRWINRVVMVIKAKLLHHVCYLKTMFVVDNLLLL